MPHPLPIRLELSVADKDFASGLLLELIDALRRTREGELFALEASERVDEDLDRWSRLTGNAIVDRRQGSRGIRYVIRNGRSPREGGDRPLGSRLWLYTNFDCNLACDYCCVRSSPTASRLELGLDRVRRIAEQAPTIGVREMFLTGGEPFLLPDIDAMVRACAEAAPTTILTNAMLFRGKRLEALRSLPREGVILQVSLDSPDAMLHDLHRGSGTWERAWAGVMTARAEGFRVRLAATVDSDEAANAFEAFLERENVAAADRVIRRVALRGLARSGVAVSRSDLVPEMTITAKGVFWHPVGADDDDLLVSREIFPLETALSVMRRAVEHEEQFSTRVASIFHCA
jgi:hypothetical protein